MKLRTCLSLILGTVFLSGCASYQLNNNTVELATSIDQLLTDQILHNLASFIDNPTAVPAQVTITSGTATTSNSITPTFSDPITKAITSSVQFITPAAVTHTHSSVAGSQAFGLSANDLWSQNWGYDPITETDPLKRLTTLYRFAIDNNEAELISSYPRIMKVSQQQRDACEGKDANGKFSRKSDGSCTTKVGQDTTSVEVLDDHFAKEPSCVICGTSKKYVNPRLKAPNGWLRWTPLPGATPIFENPPAADDVPLGHGPYGHYFLYADRAYANRFPEFAIAIAGVTATSTQSGGGGAQAGKVKTQALPLLQVVPF